MLIWEKLLSKGGAVVGDGLDLAETKIIADLTYKWFLTGDFSKDSANKIGT